MKTAQRITPQTMAVLDVARRFGHCSNHQILIEVRKKFPMLTATTVHRITNRLVGNGLLANGPQINGVQLIDANTLPHDHFMCSACDGIKDIAINKSVRASIQKELGIKRLPKSLTIYGDCDTCF